MTVKGVTLALGAKIEAYERQDTDHARISSNASREAGMEIAVGRIVTAGSNNMLRPSVEA